MTSGPPPPSDTAPDDAAGGDTGGDTGGSTGPGAQPPGNPGSPSGQLRPLGTDVHAWVGRPHCHGHPNAGVVVDLDGITLIDTLLVPSQARDLADAVSDFGVPVRRAVYTSSHAEYTGGSGVFWMAARYGRRQTSALMDQPANTAALKALHPEVADEFDEAGTRPVSHTVDSAVWLTESVCVVPTTGQMAENLVAFVPGADTLFAGAMCTFGVTPNCFDGDPVAWADALGELAELAGRIVPGVGPVGTPVDLLSLQAYLWACAEANGDPGRLAGGPWEHWSDRHLDAINVERAAMLAAGDPSVPPSMLRLLGLA